MERIQNFDSSIVRYINRNLRFKIMDYFNIAITYLGSDVFALGLLLALALLPNNVFRPFSLQTAIALILTTITVQILKYTIKRKRPFELMEDIKYIKIGTDQYSFPSGHTASSFTIAVSFGLLTNNFMFTLAYFLLAIMVGFSRVYLAVHYPSDVMCGALIGSFFAILVHIFI